MAQRVQGVAFDRWQGSLTNCIIITLVMDEVERWPIGGRHVWLQATNDTYESNLYATSYGALPPTNDHHHNCLHHYFD